MEDDVQIYFAERLCHIPFSALFLNYIHMKC